MHVIYHHPVMHISAIDVRDVVHGCLIMMALLWLSGCMPTLVAKKNSSSFVPQAVQGISGVDCDRTDDDMSC